MYIKNTLRLFINNIGLGMKAVVFRLVVTFLGLLSLYGLLYLGLAEIFQSAQMGNVIGDLKGLWLQFIGLSETTVDIQSSVKELIVLLQANFSRIVWSLLGAGVIIFAMDFLSGLCNFTLCAMVDKYMSSMFKSRFTQTFIQSLRRSVPFELFFSVVKFIFGLIMTIVLICIIVFLGQAISLLSIVFGLWCLIFIYGLFLTFTARLRPRVVQGEKISQALHNMRIKKEEFFPIYSSIIFSIVLVAYINITMLISTFGAGLMLSFPLSFLYLMCLQNVIEYNLGEKKYYIDFKTIIIPKELRSEDEKLLSDIEIN